MLVQVDSVVATTRRVKSGRRPCIDFWNPTMPNWTKSNGIFTETLTWGTSMNRAGSSKCRLWRNYPFSASLIEHNRPLTARRNTSYYEIVCIFVFVGDFCSVPLVFGELLRTPCGFSYVHLDFRTLTPARHSIPSLPPFWSGQIKCLSVSETVILSGGYFCIRQWLCPCSVALTQLPPSFLVASLTRPTDHLGICLAR